MNCTGVLPVIFQLQSTHWLAVKYLVAGQQMRFSRTHLGFIFYFDDGLIQMATTGRPGETPHGNTQLY